MQMWRCHSVCPTQVVSGHVNNNTTAVVYYYYYYFIIIIYIIIIISPVTVIMYDVYDDYIYNIILNIIII